ncbi:M23 family metallopeptidase [Streptomyces sp. NBC_01387]|uniref:M23 family metallopeptidase n=1 Tax=unclassified Streptomyces TaxID=2593676 RepID=UPI0020257944|nr:MULTISPECIES: M23 family metallopeptidase [unclassified Streptomyces]MCX4549126.1 M23 family metallopeptidase [Streptomyces sp. NBC_01500]WSC20703.1 M23 family metallopeptidase [Streptomyces sp. NBC_01766]WSV54730.1 M23 family metallopeptidase [Streptomyces sp. NBC_01014]
MQKHTKFRTPRLSPFRSRAAVIAAGLGVSVALGAGAAVAADAHPSSSAGTSSVATAVAHQAEAQAQAAAKTTTPIKTVNAANAQDAWVKPVDHVVIGEPFGIGGKMWSHKHSGQDFVMPTGTPVKAVHDGTIVKAGPNGGGDGPAYGNAIEIKVGNTTYAQYAHLSQIDVHVGQTVKAGQVIGKSGATGNVTGPHLHFEIRTGPNYGSGINPVPFLKAHGVNL